MRGRDRSGSFVAGCRRGRNGACALLAIAAGFLLFANLAKAAQPAEAPTPAPADVVVTDTDKYGEIHLDSMIALHGAGLRAWEEQTPKKDLEVYVDGILIPLPQSQILLSKLRDDWISVILTRDATDQASHDAWGPILERSMHYIGKTPHLVDVTLGRQGELPLPTKARLPMMIVDRTWFWFWLLGMAALAALLFWLGKESDLLRDQGPDPAGGRKPFSLARTQMAFWLFVVVASYLFILIVTGDTNTINDSVLGLMGISAATGFGAVMVDASKTSATRAQRDAAQKTRSELQMKKTVAPLTPAEETQLATAIADEARLNAALEPDVSKGFWWDLVSDAQSVSFHRLQIVVWTLVVGWVFVESIYHALAMPELSSTMLGLMGISGGTYLGFKLPEKQT